MTPPEDKQVALGSILSILNAKWYSIKLIQDGWIEVFWENMEVFSNEDKQELLKYNTFLKNALKSNIFDIVDIQKAILSKSMAINNFQKLVVSGEKMTTTEYFMTVLKKYWLSLKVDTEKWLKESDIWEYLKKLNFADYKEFENFKNSQLHKITNIADREFVRAYLDSLYYSWWKNWYKEDDVSTIEKQVDANKDKINELFWKLSPEVQVKLWMQKESIKDRISRDAIWALQEWAMNWWIMYAVVFWLLGKIFGWIFWIKHLWKLWLWLWFLFGSWNALWWEFKDIKEMFGWKDNWNQPSSSNTTNTQTDSVDTQTNQNNTIYTKYESLFNWNTETDKEKLKIWWELWKNDKFLNAPSSFLNIFYTEPDFEKQKQEFKKNWIDDLTESNKDIYKDIFKSILDKRKTDWIWEPQQNETLRKYLEKASNTTTDSVSGWVVTWAVVPTGTASENVNERFKVSWYTENWKNYIIGPDGNPKLIKYSQLSPEFQQQIEKLNFSGKIVNNYLMILTALSKKNPIFNEDIIDLQKNIEKIDISKKGDIEKIINFINEKNNNQSSIFLKFVNLENDLEVISRIRDIDSESAKQHLIEKLFDFTGISNEELNIFIDNPTWSHTNIQKLLWEKEYKNLAIEVSKKKSEADKYFIENREEFKNQIKTQNNTISDDEVNKILDKQYKPMITGSFVYSFAKNKLLETFLEKNTEKNWLWEYNGNNEFLKLYWDIVWVGWWNFSDKSLDWWKEAFLLIWTEIIAIWAWAFTMWAWFYVVNTAVWWIRWYKGIKALQLWNNAGKLARLWKFWAMSAVEWSSFYAWYGWAQSMIEWQNMYSLQWLWESIAFAWAFRALIAIPWLKINPNIALSEQKLRITSLLAVDTAVLWAIWLGIDWVLFEPGEWTAEHFIQAFAMAIMFRWMNHAWEKISLKFRQNGNRIEVSTTNLSRRTPEIEGNIRWRVLLRKEKWVIESNIKNLEEKILDLDSKIVIKKQKIKDLEDSTIFLPNKDADLKKLNDDLDILVKEKANFTLELETSKKSLDDNKKRSEEFKKEIKKLRDELNNTQQQALSLKQRSYNNNFVLKQLDKLEVLKTLEIWEVKITKLKKWKYEYIDWPNQFELTTKVIKNKILEIDDNLKYDFVLKQKQSSFLSSKVWETRTISWHEITIESWWTYKIIDNQNWKKLEWDELQKFIDNNLDEISKKFHGLSITQAWVKVKDWIINGYEKMWIKTLWDYLDRAWYDNWTKSKIFSKDGLRWIVLTPATTIRQLLSSKTYEKPFTNIARIMIWWNRNLHVWGWWDIIWNSWIRRAVLVWLLVIGDNFLNDEDTSTGDEWLDAAFYNYWWIINTIILKQIWWID